MLCILMKSSILLKFVNLRTFTLLIHRVNILRVAALIADLPIEVPGVVVERRCGSGQPQLLQAIQVIYQTPKRSIKKRQLQILCC